MNRLRVEPGELQENRFSRFELLPWWDQEKLARTKVLVVGAGALGNEIVKNLALLGVGKLLILDLDSIEVSNLSRSVLFSEGDIGAQKAQTAAAAARRIYPGIEVLPMNCNVLHDAGLGLFRWADLVLAGLDNREARLFISRACWKVNRPWIDGAIEGLSGVARVFLPRSAPCYECTLGEVDWQILERRMACSLLTRSEMESGRTPTTPTTSSIVAGIQVQEALKLIHGLPVLGGKGFVFDGIHHSSYTTEYTENPDCMGHDSWPEPLVFSGSSGDSTFDDVLTFAEAQLKAEDVTLEFSRDVISALQCPACDHTEMIYKPLGSVSQERGICAQCGQQRRVLTIHSFRRSDPLGGVPVLQSGLPAFDIFIARSGDRSCSILMGGDEPEILQGLAEVGERER